jgi:hypothetical protein
MTTKKDYLKRSIAYLVRQVYKCGQTEASHNKSTQNWPTPNPVGPFLSAPVFLTSP